MGRNLNFFWQRKQDKKKDNFDDYYTTREKINRKYLRKKLTTLFKKKTHDVDDDMFETLTQMLASKNGGDIEMAREIIFNSNLSNEQITKFVDDHSEVLIYGPPNNIETNISGAYYDPFAMKIKA